MRNSNTGLCYTQEDALIIRYLNLTKSLGDFLANISCTSFLGLLLQNTTARSLKQHTHVFVFLHLSGGWKSKIKVLAGLVSSEVSLLVLQTGHLLSALTSSFLCVYPSCCCVCPNVLFLQGQQS